MKPDIDYVTRDRDGRRAVCVEARLRLPLLVPGFAVLDPTPDGDVELRPAEPGKRLSVWWFPELGKLPRSKG